MVHTFVSLMQDSWSVFVSRFKAVAIVSVCMAVVLGTVQYTLVLRTQNLAGRAIERIGISDEQMRQWEEGLATGDTDTITAFEQEQEKIIAHLEAMSEQERDAFIASYGFRLYLVIIPMLLLSLLVNSVGVAYMLTYFFLLAHNKKASMATTANIALHKLWTMYLLWLWVCVRYLFWVPILNVFTIVLWGPRVAFSALIQLQEGKGPLVSVRSSYERTKGKWSMLIGQMFLLAIVTYVAWLFAWRFAQAIEKVNEWIGLYTHLTLLFLSIAFAVFFLSKLHTKLKY